MTPLDTISAIARPTGDLGAFFYFHPDTLATGKEHGLGAMQFYVLGRGGVLGDVSTAAVVAAFGYFHPAVIDKLWNRARQQIEPTACARLYHDECAARGRDSLGAVDESVLLAYADAADVVIDATSRAGLPLFAGIADLSCDDDARGRAMQKSAVLRELRGSAHLCAVVTSGLTDAQAHAVKRPADVAAFGWDPTPELPDDADELLGAAEQATDRALVAPFSALDEAGAEALVAGTEAMTDALGDWRSAR